MTDARVTRLVYDGAVYFPIVRSGAVLGPEQLDELVATPAPAPLRRFRALVADESTTRDGTRLDWSSFTPPAAVPLTYGDGAFTIGCISGFVLLPAGTVDGAVGRALVGAGRLYDNALAAIVWPAITAGLTTGLCVDVTGLEAGDRFIVQRLNRATLGGQENNCLPGAVILDTWEGEHGWPSPSAT